MMHNVKVEINNFTSSIYKFIKNKKSVVLISLNMCFIMVIYNSAFWIHIDGICGGNIIGKI